MLDGMVATFVVAVPSTEIEEKPGPEHHNVETEASWLAAALKTTIDETGAEATLSMEPGAWILSARHSGHAFTVYIFPWYPSVGCVIEPKLSLYSVISPRTRNAALRQLGEAVKTLLRTDSRVCDLSATYAPRKQLGDLAWDGQIELMRARGLTD